MSLAPICGNADMITAFIIVPHQIAGIVPPAISMAAHAAQFAILPFFKNTPMFFFTLVFAPVLSFVLPTVTSSSTCPDTKLFNSECLLLTEHKPFLFPAAHCLQHTAAIQPALPTTLPTKAYSATLFGLIGPLHG